MGRDEKSGAERKRGGRWGTGREERRRKKEGRPMGHGARGAAPKEREAADGARGEKSGAKRKWDGLWGTGREERRRKKEGRPMGQGAGGAAPKERGAADGAGARGCKGVALPPGFFVVF